MVKRTRIIPSRTKKEWDEIDKISEGTEWSIFWRRQINILREEYRQCPNCVIKASGQKYRRSIEISEGQYDFLKSLAKQMKKPIASVVNELLISPIIRKAR